MNFTGDQLQIDAQSSEGNGFSLYVLILCLAANMYEHTSVSAFIDPCDINAYFQSVSTDPNNTAPEPLKIPEGTRIPLLSINTLKHHLLNQNRSSAGPDNLPHWFWKCFASEFAPIVTEIFNVSLKTDNVPQMWKSANLLPLPKESPLNSCSQPVSLTDIIMRLN